MKQVFNPYLPSYEYIPDAEPHIFDGRVYIYGSHDRFNARSFCLNDYVSWSCPVDDLSDWRYEGVIYRRAQDPNGKKGMLNAMFAPDCVRGNDGKYYLYYFISYKGLISVARCDTPAGKYEFYGFVKYADGTLLGKKKEPLQFDPGVINDNGRIYLYTGFGPVNYPKFLLGGHIASKTGPMGFELESDMLTIKQGPLNIGVKGKLEGKGTPYEGHEFFEASSIRKYGNLYYYIYSSFEGHELCYGISDNPFGPYEYGGILVSNGDVGINGTTRENAKNYLGNTHGSILNIGDKYYVFYHRQTNKHQFSRQACAEELVFDGKYFKQAEMTSCGLNGKPLSGKGKYEAYTACNIYSNDGAYWYGVIRKLALKHPYFTQSGKDRENNPDQYIANMNNGACASFKYFDTTLTNNVSVCIKGNAKGILEIKDQNNNLISSINITPCKNKTEFNAKFIKGYEKQELTFKFVGTGHFDFYYFTLA